MRAVRIRPGSIRWLLPSNQHDSEARLRFASSVRKLLSRGAVTLSDYLIHQSMKKRILVLGAGFGGLEPAPCSRRRLATTSK